MQKTIADILKKQGVISAKNIEKEYRDFLQEYSNKVMLERPKTQAEQHTP